MPPSGRAYPQVYCIKICSQSDRWFQSYWQFCTPPVAVAVQTHCENVNLLICFTRYATHGLPGTSSCTTPYIQLSHQQPDVRVLPIQVPAWDLDPNLQDQGWGKTWLSALHPGQRGLCHHGQICTSRWSAEEWPEKFLGYIENMLDDEISPQVCVYELEDITKRSDKSIDELEDRICQLGHRAQIGNGSDGVIEFEVQCRLIWAIPDTDIELHKQLLKVSHDKRVSHLLEICRTYYAVESGVAAMCAGHVVHAVHHTHQTHDPIPLTSYTPCPNCTCQHPPSRNNCPVRDSACNGCWTKGHWWAKCCSSNTTSLQASHHQPISSHKKGREPQVFKAKTEKRPPHKDLFIAAMDCGTVGDTHPRKWSSTTSVPSSAMKCTRSKNCLQVSAVKALPQSVSRLTPDLEVTYYPSICSKNCIWNKPAQMACPLAWTLFGPS